MVSGSKGYLRFSFPFCLKDKIGGNGLSSADIYTLASSTVEPVTKMLQKPEGFVSLLGSQKTIEKIQQFKNRMAGQFATIVHLGIGGSSLGPAAIVHALKKWGTDNQFWNGTPMPRILFVDNSDPEVNAAWLSDVDPSNTLFVVVSKSGGTVEVLAQYLVLKRRLLDSVGLVQLRKRLVIITDPEAGFLRSEVQQLQLNSFSIPPDVGGRYSVLSPVGLVTCALVGIDIEALVQGAKRLCQQILKQLESKTIPAPLLSAALHYAFSTSGKNIRVIMPYCYALEKTADWFLQLWAESLGKKDNYPSTPVKAVGATDQHSQLQLYMEGPYDKIINFWTAGRTRADVDIPKLGCTHQAAAYLQGLNFNEIFKAELEGTRTALATAHRPSCELEIKQIDEYHLGALLFFLQVETVAASYLYGVDPFNQPGVELGKKIACGLLGRPNYQKWASHSTLSTAGNKVLTVPL